MYLQKIISAQTPQYVYHALQNLKSTYAHICIFPIIHTCSIYYPIIVLLTTSFQRTESPIHEIPSYKHVCNMWIIKHHISTSLDRLCVRSCSHNSHLPRHRGNWSIHYHSSEWHPYNSTPYVQRNRNMVQEPLSQYLNKPPRVLNWAQRIWPLAHS